MIQFTQSQIDDLQAHGQEAFPDECCGAMLGDLVDGNKIVKALVKIENNSTENKNRRFAITPDDYRSLEKLAKEKSLTLLGFYHTHPKHPAIPSETDLKFAWPFFSYVIQSVFADGPKEVLSYELDVDAGAFKSESLVIA